MGGGIRRRELKDLYLVGVIGLITTMYCAESDFLMNVVEAYGRLEVYFHSFLPRHET